MTDKTGGAVRIAWVPWVRVLALAFLAFTVPELISGATVISHAATAIPVFLLYGAGVVCIRELSRRSATGLIGAAMLGVTYAIVEEGEALGSLFSPTILGAADLGGRALGVNWIWFVWVTGVHVVFSVLVPIAAVELVFSRKRCLPWMSRTGLVAAGVIWLAAATVIGVFFRTHLLAADPPPRVLLLAAAAMATGIAGVALALGRRQEARGRSPPPPAPIWVGMIAFGLSACWGRLAHLPAPLKTYPLALVPLTAAMGLAALSLRQFLRWSRGSGWTDTHTAYALWGLLTVDTAQGAFLVATMGTADRIGQLAAGLAAAAVVLLGLLQSRQASSAEPSDRTSGT